MIENFFISSFDKKKYHEILILYELEFRDSQFYKKEIIANIEEKNKEEITYTWMAVKDLKNCNFQPNIILDMIDKSEFQHYVSK